MVRIQQEAQFRLVPKEIMFNNKKVTMKQLFTLLVILGLASCGQAPSQPESESVEIQVEVEATTEETTEEVTTEETTEASTEETVVTEEVTTEETEVRY